MTKVAKEPSHEVERKRFSFDLRTDLQRQLKLQCIMDDKSMYETIEELIEAYLNERRNEGSKEN